MTQPPLPLGGSTDDDAVVEALLTGARSSADPVSDVLDAIRAGGHRPPPAPSAALAELFATGLPADEVGRRRNRARIVVGMLVASGTTLALTGVAAANDALPGGAQSVVTDIVNGLTPFHIVRQRDDRRPQLPAPTDTVPHRSPEAGDDRGGNRPAGPSVGSGEGSARRSGGDDAEQRSSSTDGSGGGTGEGSGGTGEGSGGTGSGSGTSDSGRTDGSGSASGGGSGEGSTGSGSGGSGSGSGGSDSASGSGGGGSSGGGSDSGSGSGGGGSRGGGGSGSDG